MTAWHVVAMQGKLEIFQKIWDLFEQNVTIEETKNKFLFATDDMGRTVLHLAAECYKPWILQEILRGDKRNL